MRSPVCVLLLGVLLTACDSESKPPYAGGGGGTIGGQDGGGGSASDAADSGRGEDGGSRDASMNAGDSSLDASQGVFDAGHDAGDAGDGVVDSGTDANDSGTDDDSGSLGADGGAHCVDRDGDRYGVDCIGGADCDEDDPFTTNECAACADGPREGCACTPQPSVFCIPPPIPHPQGLLVASAGARACRNDEWSRCEATDYYYLVPR